MYHFKGIKQETKEEKRERILKKFKKDYNAYVLAQERAIDKIIIEEILK